MKVASRLSLLPPYLFAELDRLKREVAQTGVDVISLGIGDPDLPTPQHIVEALKRAAEIPANHRYPDYQGLDRFREAATGWYKRRFNVTLDSGNAGGTNHFVLSLASVAGENYQLEFADALPATVWSNVPGGVVSNAIGGPLSFSNFVSVTAPQRFYRLQITP